MPLVSAGGEITLDKGNWYSTSLTGRVNKIKNPCEQAERKRRALREWLDEQAFHAAVLSAVKTTLLPAITNQELKDFVTSLAPAFEAHRLGAENLEKKIGASE